MDKQDANMQTSTICAIRKIILEAHLEKGILEAHLKKKEIKDCAYDELLNTIGITVLEYAWGSKKCIKMLTDSKNHYF